MPSLHLNPPFRAEHVGSLLRTPELLQKREEFKKSQCSVEELRAVQDKAIVSVVQMQRDIGLSTITDGEYRRNLFYEGMFERLDGMTFVPSRPLSACNAFVPYIELFKERGLTEIPSIYCTSKIKRTGGVYTQDFLYMRNLVKPEEVKRIKVTICSPIWLHLRHGPEHTYDHSVYANDDEYFADLVAAYREEIHELYDMGCRNIQIDDPAFCFFCSESMRNGMRKQGLDPDEVLGKYITVHNSVSAGRPNDLIIGVHMCRGNYQGEHYCEGGYEPIAAKVFQNLDVDCFYLEYDTERAGDIKPLRYLPLNKVAVLGLVTTKTGTLETLNDIKSRVLEAVEALCNGYPQRSQAEALNQLCISPQCGFASVAEGNPITEEEQRRKLALIVEAANAIWG
ncbi:UROD/MetE-like protein [Panus rudis PR-1116 ss-1]|nr:UROD/MetE-like protein [Panus rudis PR-1116 ss-1]